MKSTIVLIILLVAATLLAQRSKFVRRYVTQENHPWIKAGDPTNQMFYITNLVWGYETNGTNVELRTTKVIGVPVL